ncbi:MAG: hypothetical protein L6Q80_08065 [Dehalococcoidia bacterium]|nr:hypothetical protein [Dehalococcoidia bacterium]
MSLPRENVRSNCRGTLAADAVVVEEEPRLDAEPLGVLDRLERLAHGRDRPDVRPDDRGEAFLLERLGEGAGLDQVRVAEEVGPVRRAEDGDVRLEGTGRLALAQQLVLSRAARDAQAFGLPLDPHRLPLPRPTKTGRSYALRPAGGSGVGARGALTTYLTRESGTGNT